VARRGWGGSPPADDQEASARILRAAVRLVEREGTADFSLTDVARELGVTRATVYRYFASTKELLATVAESEMPRWISRIRTVVDSSEAPAETLIEATAFVIEELPREPLLILLLTSGDAGLMRQMLTPATIERCRGLLDASAFDWYAAGIPEESIDELVELLLRIIQSMVVAPPETPRSPGELRAFLRRWIGPALTPQLEAERS
jgi:AcrR family transcriptional regulator